MNITRAQKSIFYLLLVIGLVYFTVFFIPNLTGAKDSTMLSVFENDEYAQYPNVVRMITPGESPLQTIRNFVVYLHYYYGYPFYFFSALAILPIKWIIGLDWASHTQLLVVMLRQMINVLPMILAALLLVWNQTKFKSWWKTVLLFVFILTIPGAVSNNMWWHPDSLLVLFSVLTIFFLMRDQGRFGRNFYFSGIACGLSIGTKVLGVLFILTYASYLIYGLVTRSLSLKKAVWSAFLFLVVLFGSIIISNPLLLMPIERGEIIAIFKANYLLNSQGFWIFGNGNENQYELISGIIGKSYNGLILFFITLVFLIAGLFSKQKRLNNLILITWVVGFLGYFLLNVSSFRTHYLLPVMLPFYSVVLDPYPDDLRTFFRIKKPTKIPNVVVTLCKGLFLVFLLFIMGKNIKSDYNEIKTITQREQTSESIALFNKFSKILPNFPDHTPVIIYRDWRAYVAERPNWQIEYSWDLANYEYLSEIRADFLFIEEENVHYFSDETNLERAINPESMQMMFDFYSDVGNENVDGYKLLIKNDFGHIYVSDTFYSEYFK